MYFFFLPWALASSIDATFQIERLERRYRTALQESTGISFYQRVLSQSLASDCKFYPNDSRKAKLDFARCGTVYSIFSAMERFFGEPNAGELRYALLYHNQKISFFHLPTNCHYFNEFSLSQ